MKRNARWYGPRARALLAKLRRREAVVRRWRDTGTQDILRDVNAALAAVYDDVQPEPQALLMSYGAYMILTGHIWVKLGRRGGKWVKR